MCINESQSIRRRPRAGRAVATLIAAALALSGSAALAQAAGASSASRDRTAAVGLIPFPGDVYQLNYQGALVPVDPASTPSSAALYNLAGNALNVTWGRFSSATATSLVKTVTRKGTQYTDFKIALGGLVPNGVYSLFYRTFNPNSTNVFCPNVEPTVALTAAHPKRQAPDASSK